MIMAKKNLMTDVKALSANDVNLVNADEQSVMNVNQANEAEAIKKQAAIDEATKALESAKVAYETAKAELKKLTGKEKKEKVERGPGVIASIFSMVSNSKKGCSKEELIEELVKLFPERSREGMLKTIQVQLPSRMGKEKKVNIVKENDKFLIK
jgi:hypothetical protein